MNDSRKSIIIIGAGLAGLASGCYAQMNGYESRIFEKHFIPGGCCTAWQRGDYTFDCTIEWMLGSGAGSYLNGIWNELGGLEGKKVTHFDIFNSYQGLDGKLVHFYVEPDRLEAHLNEISPEDRELIAEFCNDLRQFGPVNRIISEDLYKPESLRSAAEQEALGARLQPYLELMGRTIGTTVAEYAARFKDHTLSEAFKNVMFLEQNPHFPLMPTYFNLRSATDRDAGFPEGGSLGVSNSLAERYQALGGQIEYSTTVERILVENGRACGVKMADGTEYRADVVVAACDVRTILFDMLGGAYQDAWSERIFNQGITQQPELVYPGMTMVFLGVNRDMSKELHSVAYELTDAEAAQLTGLTQSKTLLIQIRSQHCAAFAPPGQAVVAVYYFSEFDCWDKLHQDSAAYQQEKSRISQFAMAYLEKIYPGITSQVKNCDVSTPVTLKRYTGSSKGSLMGLQPFSEADEYSNYFQNEAGMQLPGLANLYIAGQWVSMGGVIRSAASGRHVVQFICKDHGKEFRTTTQNNREVMCQC